MKLQTIHDMIIQDLFTIQNANALQQHDIYDGQGCKNIYLM